MLLLVTAGLSSCAKAPPSWCSQVPSAMPFVTAFTTAMFFGLISAQSAAFGFVVSTILAAYLSWVDSGISIQAGCGLPICRIFANIVAMGMEWFVGSCRGYALKDASAWLRLGGGALSGSFAFIWGTNLANGSC